MSALPVPALIDNTSTADGAGPIKVFSLADGKAIMSFGSDIYTAFALGGTGLASRFLFVDAVRDPSSSPAGSMA